jgi:hypothetical protein
MVLLLAQTMGTASAEPKAGHGGSKGNPHSIELTSHITRHPAADSHSSRGDRSDSSERGHSANQECRGEGCARGYRAQDTGSRGHERPDIASPITLPVSTVPNTTVPHSPPTTQPRPTTTVTTTVPPTTPPTAPPTVPPIVGSGTPSSPATNTAPASTSPALGGTTPIQGVATLQSTATASTPSTTAAAKGANGRSAPPGTSVPTVQGLLNEPMVLANGGWKGLSLRAATNLKVPILFGIVVALFVLVQALIDRRDPKMSRAPERNDEDTVGFQ